jgi:lipopolysaccharide transport system ATP-binding protein
MSETIIRVENLGKKYQLGRNAAQSGARYRTLRETLTDAARGAFRNPKSALRDSPSEEFWALRNVSFEVKQGEVVGIIGRNGAGKSTLLKILSRITEPTTGRIAIEGRVASLLEVGTGFHPELTGRENIFLNGAILGMTRAEIKAKFDEIVAFAEVAKFLDTPVKRYSSGMYVRLAFAVAAHLEPEILIVDEVLAVGDAEFQKKCLGKMQDVSRGGRTVLFVSHNLTAVAALCSSALLLDQGSIANVGAVKECLAEYSKQTRIPSIKRAGTCQIGFQHVALHETRGDRRVAVDLATAPGEYHIVFHCVLPSTPDVNIGFTLVNDNEAPVASSCIRDVTSEVKTGDITYEVGLPVEALPSGSYRVEAAIWDAERQYAQGDGLLSFTVTNHLSYLDRKGVPPRGGVLIRSAWTIATNDTAPHAQ